MLRSFASMPARTVVPPIRRTPSIQTGDFTIKVTVYEKCGDEKIKRFTGYSQESDIIPKTYEYCESVRSEFNACSVPIVRTTTSKKFLDCIVIDDIVHETTDIKWF